MLKSHLKSIIMYFKCGHGEAKALFFCVMTTVAKHLDHLSSPKVNVQTTEPQPRSNTHTLHMTHTSGWYGITFPARYYFRILVISVFGSEFESPKPQKSSKVFMYFGLFSLLESSSGATLATSFSA